MELFIDMMKRLYEEYVKIVVVLKLWSVSIMIHRKRNI